MLNRRDLFKWFVGTTAAAVVAPEVFEEIYEDEFEDDIEPLGPCTSNETYDLCDPIANQPYSACTCCYLAPTIHWRDVRGLTIGNVVIDEVSDVS